MKRIIAAFLAGALFGVGLVLGGMSDPIVVLGFLDVAGDLIRRCCSSWPVRWRPR